MRLKLHILFVLGMLYHQHSGFAVEKFLRVSGELIDAVTKEPITNFKVKQIEDEVDSTIHLFEKSSFDVWVSPNLITKLYFIKDGYIINHLLIEASFIPSIAYKKKQKLELTVQMYKPTSSIKKLEKPRYVVVYVARDNGFVVEDMTAKKNQVITQDYQPPFPSPADTYTQVKPTSRTLALTSSFNKKKANGNSGMARVLQGVLFADLNYCFFNERTNDANEYLGWLSTADNETWGSIKPFDSPEYGKIISRTINREQSIDTLFALGAHLETSRLIYQNFTSDSKVLIHLKTLKNVLLSFDSATLPPDAQQFLMDLNELVPLISDLEETYKDLLRQKLNFEMHEDKNFHAIKNKTEQIYLSVIE